MDIIASGGDQKEAEEKSLDLFKDAALDKIFELAKSDSPFGIAGAFYDDMKNTIYGEQLIGNAWRDNYDFDDDEFKMKAREYGSASPEALEWEKAAKKAYRGMADAASAIEDLKGGGDE